MSLIVLIVDDDTAVRFFHQVIVAQSLLSSTPLTFARGEELLAYLKENYQPGKTYLILLDINMPVMNGWDLLDAIKENNHYHNVYFVIVTSSVDKADKEKAKQYDMIIDVVEKPITDEACKNIIKHPALSPN